MKAGRIISPDGLQFQHPVWSLNQSTRKIPSQHKQHKVYVLRIKENLLQYIKRKKANNVHQNDQK